MMVLQPLSIVTLAGTYKDHRLGFTFKKSLQGSELWFCAMGWRGAPEDYQWVPHESLMLAQRSPASPPLQAVLKQHTINLNLKQQSNQKIRLKWKIFNENNTFYTVLNLLKLPLMSILDIFCQTQRIQQRTSGISDNHNIGRCQCSYVGELAYSVKIEYSCCNMSELAPPLDRVRNKDGIVSQIRLPRF